MMLREFLRAVPATRVVLRLTTESLTYGELLHQWPERAAAFQGRKVLLWISQLEHALPALVHLDGVASLLLLAPANTSPQNILALGQQAGCDVLLTDGRLLDDLPSTWCQYRVPDDLATQGRKGVGGLLPERPEGCFAQKTPDPFSPLPTPSPTISTEWVLPTSGTTGTAKLVSHSLASLTRTTRVDVRRGADCRWGLLYDYARFAGLQVVLQALLPGSMLIAPSLASSLPEQVEALVQGGCTHLSATPTLWRKILMTEGSDQLKLQQITLGGEIVEERVLKALGLRFPEARITHIYASTEAGVGFSVSDGHEGFPAGYLTESPSGIELRVRAGKLYVRNPSVKPQYVGSVDQFADHEGFVDTGDVVAQRGDRFVFLGRETGIINVGGNKVHPEEVEQILMSHPEVWQAKVSAKRSPITGSLVAGRDCCSAQCRGSCRTA